MILSRKMPVNKSNSISKVAIDVVIEGQDDTPRMQFLFQHSNLSVVLLELFKAISQHLVKDINQSLDLNSAIEIIMQAGLTPEPARTTS